MAIKGSTLDQGSKRWQYSEIRSLLYANGNELERPKTRGSLQGRSRRTEEVRTDLSVIVETWQRKGIVGLESRLSDTCRIEFRGTWLRTLPYAAAVALGVVTWTDESCSR